MSTFRPKKKIMMFGPPKGHNIRLYLEFFNKREDHYSLTYIFSGKKKYSFEEFNNVKFIDKVFQIHLFIKELFRLGDYDLIWIHNWTRVHVILLVLFFNHNRTRINFSVWSEPILRKALSGSFQGKIYKYIFKNVDYVQCLWIGLFDLVREIDPKINKVLFHWGLPPQYFIDIKCDYSEETIKFIEDLPKDKIKFFWPKSISKASRHDLVIDAAKLLVDKNINSFKIYFWLGNAINKRLYKSLNDQIILNDLQKYVVFINHSFLSFNDIILIWKQMDVGLQISAHDALSTSLMEPLLFKKEVIVSNIYPYRKLENSFNFQLRLVELNAVNIMSRMEEIISGQKTDDLELSLRSKVIRENFNFESNTEKTIKFFTS